MIYHHPKARDKHHIIYTSTKSTKTAAKNSSCYCIVVVVVVVYQNNRYTISSNTKFIQSHLILFLFLSKIKIKKKDKIFFIICNYIVFLRALIQKSNEVEFDCCIHRSLGLYIGRSCVQGFC